MSTRPDLYTRPDPNVQQMPPLDNVGDPTIRAYLMALDAAWNERNGLNGNSDKRFLTRAEVMQESLQAVARVFASGSDAIGGINDVPTAQAVQNQIAAIQDIVRKSLIFQALENAIGNINLSAINAEISASLETAYAAIGSEQTVRAGKDNALASAINQIWSQIGGSTAVILDGQLASVTPSGSSATKWTQVVASVTDPNTGLVNSTSIKQDLNVYANAANSTFNAIYSVRAQVSVGGQTVVGGFGLSATSGAGSAQGATIDFGVRADKFFIAATSATPDGQTQANQGNSIPFIVITAPQFVDGVLYNPGVYMKTATIADATIGTAKIADASITNAKIGFSIQSSNWNGSVGWYIDKSGAAYFMNVYVRGDVLATSVTTNILTAAHIISDSLNFFYSHNAGQQFMNLPLGAKCIRVSAWPGYELSGGGVGKDPTQGATQAIELEVKWEGNVVGRIYGVGTVHFYNLGSGTVSVWESPVSFYGGRVDYDVIVR